MAQTSPTTSNMPDSSQTLVVARLIHRASGRTTDFPNPGSNGMARPTPEASRSRCARARGQFAENRPAGPFGCFAYLDAGRVDAAEFAMSAGSSQFPMKVLQKLGASRVAEGEHPPPGSFTLAASPR
jgi:hypothetical protein